MSASSASSPRRRVADIIDLDRYMRSAVKPSRDYREHFVVDAGGVDRAPHYSSGCSDSSALPPALTPALTPAPAHRTAPSTHNKRFSHDSGLSDGSYVRRRQKSHRRKPDVLSKQRDQPLPPYSSPSVREFRVACEKALREQQEQIARVAELCERLAQPAPGGDRDAAQRARVEKTGHRSRAGQKEKAGDSSDTSDLSSSSSSQVRRKDKRRSESCKTYKIIMSKLDELNRLFAARRATSPAPARCPSPCPSPPRRAVSSRSVSVCDKVVATEPLNRNVNRAVTPTVQTVLTPRDQRCSEYAASVDGLSLEASGPPARRSERGARCLTITIWTILFTSTSKPSACKRSTPARSARPRAAASPRHTTVARIMRCIRNMCSMRGMNSMRHIHRERALCSTRAMRSPRAMCSTRAMCSPRAMCSTRAMRNARAMRSATAMRSARVCARRVAATGARCAATCRRCSELDSSSINVVYLLRNKLCLSFAAFFFLRDVI
ncbi:uncharacterized protein [Epargyreus clarus]|uniref:uncharacterized protein isoform X1 n=1 Tax=Epargyreus clarus TaxID=520877 RepID=UPI003C2AD7A5